jgi:nucleoside-diphosphate-sugar epimerase
VNAVQRERKRYTNMPSFAVFGATGQTGGPIAKALRDAGVPYRAVARNRAALETRFADDPLAEIVTWNPDEPESVKAAAADIDTIFYAVGVPYDRFDLHPVLMQQTLEGAISAGVQRIVLISNVYLYGMPQTTPVREDHPREPHTFKGKMRKAQEDILFAAHASGDIEATVLRLPSFYGPNVARTFVVDAFLAAVQGRRAKLIGPIDTPRQFVFVPDVGAIAVALAQEPRAYGSTWNFAGSGTITQREFVQRIFAQVGSDPKFFVANKTMLRILGVFNPLMRDLAEMQYLQAHPIIMDDSALHELLPGIKATSYDDGIAQTLAAMKTTESATKRA